MRSKIYFLRLIFIEKYIKIIFKSFFFNLNLININLIFFQVKNKLKYILKNRFNTPLMQYLFLET
jgi:hypothetical protein